MGATQTPDRERSAVHSPESEITRPLRVGGSRALSVAPAPEPVDARFRVLNSYAQGGLGEVYLAVDNRFGREVALKQLKPEYALDIDARARFVREAELTGLLEHPGIVPVYDLGQKSDGHLYYAMRLIRGSTLHQAITAFHGPDGPKGGDRRVAFRELLARVVTVCHAIGYAHDRGIIHRDLKPANIMIGPYGETLIVDWGLAKRFDPEQPAAFDDLEPLPAAAFRNDHDGSTQVGDTLGTPAYMSPEQASGRPDAVGPASDIYSLGATLTHVLTGQSPKPQQLPKFDSTVPKPLAAIVAKAMARAPGDRYSSAQALANDLDRFLADEPVLACPEPWTGRLARWARQHRTLVTSAIIGLGVAVLALSAALLVINEARNRTELARQETATKKEEADRLAAEALRQRQRTRQALDAMTSNLAQDNLAGQPSLTPAQKQFLKQLLGYYQEFAKETANDPEGELLIAEAQYRLGTILFELRQLDDAEQAARASLRSSEALRGRHPEIDRKMPIVHRQLMLVLEEKGRLAEAEVEGRHALRYAEELYAKTQNADDLASLATTCSWLADLFNETGNFDESVTLSRRVLDMRAAALVSDPKSFTARLAHAVAQRLLAKVLADRGEYEEALQLINRSVATTKELATATPWDPSIRFSATASHTTRGLIDSRRGDYRSALEAFRKALPEVDSLIASSPGTATYRIERFTLLSNMCICLQSLDQKQEARELGRQAIEMGRKLVAEYPAQVNVRGLLTRALNTTGINLNSLGQFAESEKHYREAITEHERLHALVPNVPEFQIHHAGLYCNLALLYHEQNRDAEALPFVDRAIEMLMPWATRPAPYALARSFLGNSYNARSHIQEKLGNTDLALADAVQACRWHNVPQPQVVLRTALMEARQGHVESAVERMDRFLEGRTCTANFLAESARVYALAGDDESRRKAMTLFRTAHENGFRMPKGLDHPDFHSLQQEDDWPALKARLQLPKNGA